MRCRSRLCRDWLATYGQEVGGGLTMAYAKGSVTPAEVWIVDTDIGKAST